PSAAGAAGDAGAGLRADRPPAVRDLVEKARRLGPRQIRLRLDAGVDPAGLGDPRGPRARARLAALLVRAGGFLVGPVPASQRAAAGDLPWWLGADPLDRPALWNQRQASRNDAAR